MRSFEKKYYPSLFPLNSYLSLELTCMMRFPQDHHLLLFPTFIVLLNKSVHLLPVYSSVDLFHIPKQFPFFLVLSRWFRLLKRFLSWLLNCHTWNFLLDNIDFTFFAWFPLMTICLTVRSPQTSSLIFQNIVLSFFLWAPLSNIFTIFYCQYYKLLEPKGWVFFHNL
jgi:hypothetical protein